MTYKLIEADSYENRAILVVGGGDSAVEAALALSKAKRNRVTLCCRAGGFHRARERNQAMIAEAEQQRRVTVLRRSQVLEICPDSVIVTTAQGRIELLPNDYIFTLIGGESPEDFLRKTGIEIVEKRIGEVPCYQTT